MKVDLRMVDSTQVCGSVHQGGIDDYR